MCAKDVTVIRGRLRGALRPGGRDPCRSWPRRVWRQRELPSAGPAETRTARNGTETVSVEADEPAADPIDDEAEIVKTLEVVLAGDDPASVAAIPSPSAPASFNRDVAGCEAAQKAAKRRMTPG